MRNLPGYFAAVAFSASNGMAGIAVPLIAVNAGFGLPDIALLVALSAVSQVLIRSVLGYLLARFPDRALILSAGVLMAASNAILIFPPSWATLLISAGAQGIARAFFWTGSQTHAVRVSPSPVRGLAALHFVGGLGNASGPLIAGAIFTFSPPAAMAVATGVALLVVVPSAVMVRLDPLRPPAGEGAGGLRGRWSRLVFLHARIRSSAWPSATAGAWRALATSFLPVALATGGSSAAEIGLILTLSGAAGVLGSLLGGEVPQRWQHLVVGASVVTCGIGLAAAGLVPENLVFTSIALIVAGFGVGVIQTLTAAIAADSVEPDERGQAIASAGIYRGVALLVSPFIAAGAVALGGYTVAALVLGVVLALPATAARKPRRSGDPDAAPGD